VIFAIGMRAYRLPVAALGAGLAALHPGLLAYTMKLHPLGIDVLLMALLVLWIGRAGDGLRSGLTAGLALGMTLMSRPTFFVAGLAGLAFRWRGSQKILAPVLATVVVAGVLATPWVARNWALLGRPVFVPQPTTFREHVLGPLACLHLELRRRVAALRLLGRALRDLLDGAEVCDGELGAKGGEVARDVDVVAEGAEDDGERVGGTRVKQGVGADAGDVDEAHLGKRPLGRPVDLGDAMHALVGDVDNRLRRRPAVGDVPRHRGEHRRLAARGQPDDRNVLHAARLRVLRDELAGDARELVAHLVR